MEHKPIKSPVGKKNKQIWEAYQEVIEELRAKEEVPSTEAVAQAKRLGDAIKMANTVDVDSIVSNLDGLSSGLEDAKNVFADLNAAIDAKKGELKEVHKLEKEANSLAALVAARDVLIADRTETAESILAEAKEEAKSIKEKATAEANKISQEAAEEEATAKKDRDRQQAEWEYDFSRRCKAKEDHFTDRINDITKAIEVREAAVTEREANIDKLDAQIKELEKQIEINTSNEAARVAEAVEEAKARAKKGFHIEKSMVEKSYEAKLTVANARIEDQNGFIAELRQRLDKAEALIASANERVTNIATASLKAGADAATISRVSEIAAGAGSKK